MSEAIARRSALTLHDSAASAATGPPALAQPARTGRANVGCPPGGTASSVTRMNV